MVLLFHQAKLAELKEDVERLAAMDAGLHARRRTWSGSRLRSWSSSERIRRCEWLEVVEEGVERVWVGGRHPKRRVWCFRTVA